MCFICCVNDDCDITIKLYIFIWIYTGILFLLLMSIWFFVIYFFCCLLIASKILSKV